MSDTIVNGYRTIVLAVTVVFVSAIVASGIYHVNDRILMSKNIDSAITKGMDPLSVRCAFAQDDDTICIAYAASSKR